MGKLFRLFALFLGVFTLASGLSSCKDECCTFTDGTDTYTYCEDNVPEGYTWAQVQALATLYGGSCD